MVYPEDYTSSPLGGRDIIDGATDVQLPFVLLVRHGSSDHIQPNFPTPGQIRSMFNTGKISECPEYSISPSTMSDPLEWRQSNQVELLEEKLMRIHRWSDRTSFLNHNYEGHTVPLTNLYRYNEIGFEILNEDNISAAEPRNRAEICGNVDNQTMDINYNDYETHSEFSGQSERLLEGSDVDYNHREYDVEEYVEQINNFTDVSENSSKVYSDAYFNNQISKPEKNVVSENKTVNSESFERQKQLEYIFNLKVKEHDNPFVGELKTVLLEKLKNYFLEKDDENKCSLSDDIRKVADILNRAITDKDSVICDKVHELCLRLRDILVLKDEILLNASTENVKNEFVHQLHSETCLITSLSSPSASNINNSTEMNRSFYNKYTEDDYNKEKTSQEKVTCIHNFNKDSELKLGNSNKESFESLVKFSRIPVAKSKLPKALGSKQFRNIQKSSAPKIPVASVKRFISNGKQDHLIVEHRGNHVNKRVNSRQTKDILQQKEEIIKKAIVLGLVDSVNDIGKVPHLTERAQLALLEKQIQGKLKSKQLALERKKVGLRDRISNVRLSNSSSNEMCNKPTMNKPLKSPTLENQDNEHEENAQPCTMKNNTNFQNNLQNQSFVIKHHTNRKPLEEFRGSIMEPLGDNDFPKSKENCIVTDNIADKLMYTYSTCQLDQDNINLQNEEIELASLATKAENTKLTTLQVGSVNPTPIAPEKSNERAYENICPALPTNRRSLGNLLPFLVITTVIVLLCAVGFVYQEQLFDCYNQYSLVAQQLWKDIRRYNYKEELDNNFRKARKYVKDKCELL